MLWLLPLVVFREFHGMLPTSQTFCDVMHFPGLVLYFEYDEDELNQNATAMSSNVHHVWFLEE